MKKLFIPLILCTMLCSCTSDKSIGIIGGADGPTSIYVSDKGEKEMYQQISPQKAKEIMDSEENIIILDVREQYELMKGI